MTTAQDRTVNEHHTASGGSHEVRILLTGFGPFLMSDGSEITKNPSYAAIVPLTDKVHIAPSGSKIRFSTLEIPVVYDDVTKIVPGLHKGGFQYIIHLGVGLNGSMTLEERAHSGGYEGKDIHGRQGPLKGNQVYVTKWDAEKLVNQLHALGIKDVRVSDDAGRYLCEFIYFRSMEESEKSGIPVLFCHVPQEGNPFSLGEMTDLIVKLVELMVESKNN